jgi:hypothetical protein
LPAELTAAVDRWAEQHETSRSEAIRQLVEAGLGANALRRPASEPAQKTRAHELASKTIDRMMDPAAPSEERAQRRRRLTKGPSEFREDRVDLPKAKTK